MIEQLRKELAADEGCVTHTYLCSEGHLTVGIGHLCQEGDPEFWKSIGTAVSEDRVDELFGKDIAWTMADCRDIVPKFDDMPREHRFGKLGRQFQPVGCRLTNDGLVFTVVASRQQQDSGCAEDEGFHRAFSSAG